MLWILQVNCLPGKRIRATAGSTHQTIRTIPGVCRTFMAAPCTSRQPDKAKCPWTYPCTFKRKYLNKHRKNQQTTATHIWLKAHKHKLSNKKDTEGSAVYDSRFRNKESSLGSEGSRIRVISWGGSCWRGTWGGFWSAGRLPFLDLAGYKADHLWVVYFMYKYYT